MRESLGRHAVVVKARACGRLTREAARAHERRKKSDMMVVAKFCEKKGLRWGAVEMVFVGSW